MHQNRRFGRRLGSVTGTPSGANNNNVVGNSQNGETTMAKLTMAEGSTRGKNPRKITYLKFDREVVENLPKKLAEFLEATKSANEDKPFTEEELTSFAVDGFNLASYSAASDEIGEFIPDGWPSDTKAQFRLAVRNTSKIAGLSIEDTVAMLLPAVEKGIAAKKLASEQTVTASA